MTLRETCRRATGAVAGPAQHVLLALASQAKHWLRPWRRYAAVWRQRITGQACLRDVFLETPVARPVPVYQLGRMRRFLRLFGAEGMLDWQPAEAETDLWGGARCAIGLYWQSGELRRRFPRGLADGPEGGYARWLAADGAAAHRLTSRAIEHIRQAFAHRPGDRIRQVYQYCPDVRRHFPLALTPAGLRSYLGWLFLQGRGELGVRDEEIVWFLHECVADPWREVERSYRMNPDWQRQLAPTGRMPTGPALQGWLRQTYGYLDPPCPSFVRGGPGRSCQGSARA